MPRSKKRVLKKSATANAIRFENVLTSWMEDYVLRSTNPDVGPLAAATALWAGIGDPDKRGVNQCMFACGMVQGVLAELGHASKVLPVQVLTSRPGESDRRLGSPSPTTVGMNWSGHCVLWIPGMSIIFDPTVGQARMATNRELRHPVVMHNPAFADLPPVGSVFRVKRQDVTFDFQLIHDNGSLEAALELQRKSVREAVQRTVDTRFRQYVSDIQKVALKNAAT